MQYITLLILGVLILKHATCLEIHVPRIGKSSFYILQKIHSKSNVPVLNLISSLIISHRRRWHWRCFHLAFSHRIVQWKFGN